MPSTTALPLDEQRLCTCVRCGNPDPGAALAEVARVLKPGAALHFVEHGLAPEPGVARWQQRGNPINRIISGCVLDNDVRGLLDRSPLTITALDSWYQQGAPRTAGYMYQGHATA